MGGFFFPAQPAGVNSVFGRVGNVVAMSGDYTAAQVTNAVDQTGSYADPSWITSLDYSKITGAPILYYQLAQINGGLNLPQRPRFNFIAGTGVSLTGADDSGNNRTNITIAADAVSNLNGISTPVQTFSPGTAGSDFNIVSSGSVHTFNIPSASATKRGLLTEADWTNFNAKEPPITPSSNVHYYRGDKVWEANFTYENTILPVTTVLSNVGVSTVANRIHIRRFSLPQSWLIRRTRVHVSTAAASGLIGFAIYNMVGALLYSTGALDASTTGTKTYDLGSVLKIPPGQYLLAWATNNASIQTLGLPHNPSALTLTSDFFAYDSAATFSVSGFPASINPATFLVDTISNSWQAYLTSY